ncbi:DMT family transporter [Oceanobacter kriegii]|uniref:DMT family transporter n=1 Tax=Oceanobacter kriegii TaxID=64972 RepID=UPI00042853A9|nr:DMT family transporter [Oceanobacter kriegii]
MSRSPNITAVWLLLLCAFLWGASFPVGKHALGEIHALTLVLCRFGLASLCLLALMRLKRIAMPRLSLRQWSWVLAVSLVGVGGLNLGLFTGLAQTEANNGALIMALSPLATMLIASVAQRRWLTGSQGFSLLVCLTGVLLVLTKGDWQRLMGFEFNHGDKMILAGMLCWSFYTYQSQAIGRWMPMIPYTTVGMLAGVAVIGTATLFSAEVHPLQELQAASGLVLADVVFIGIMATVGGYLLWIAGVKQLGAANASLFFNFVPVFSALTALVFGQTVTALQVLGIAIVIAGLLLPRLYASVVRPRSAETVLQ